jgi:predicted SAM-dependent methyltransferase
MSNEKLLNIGCGETLHPDWENVDIVASMPGVHAHDVRSGLPYADDMFDACYCSHMLEHVTKEQAKVIVGETYRVLKKGGIARFVVPDLEQVVRLYLECLEDVVSGQEQREADYDWMIMELLDQTVRSSSGGEMGVYLSDPTISNKAFVVSRIGLEAEKILHRKSLPKSARVRAKLQSMKLSWFVRRLRIELASLLVMVAAGSDAKRAFREGLFRNSGEIHRWMYDSFSLQRLLTQAGFVGIKICNADESLIPDFNSYDLDIIDNEIRKPDSLYMEAVKP